MNNLHQINLKNWKIVRKIKQKNLAWLNPVISFKVVYSQFIVLLSPWRLVVHA